MFDALSDRLQAALGDVRSRGKLSEDDVNAAMREIRLALLEADVNFKVVKQFTAAVKERALGQDVLQSLNPGQQVVKIVSDELTQLMGGSGRELAFAKIRARIAGTALAEQAMSHVAPRGSNALPHPTSATGAPGATGAPVGRC